MLACDSMTNIVPVSDLKNYTEVLSHCNSNYTSSIYGFIHAQRTIERDLLL